MLDNKYKVRVSHFGTSKAGIQKKPRKSRVARRKKILAGLALIIVLAVLMGGVFLWQRRVDDKNGVTLDRAVMVSLSGPVSGVAVQQEGRADFEQAESEQDVTTGMNIRVDGSNHAALKIGEADQAIYVRLNHNARVKIKRALDSQVELELVDGELWIYRPKDGVDFTVFVDSRYVRSKSLTDKNIFDVTRHGNRLVINNLTGELAAQGLLDNIQPDQTESSAALHYKKKVIVDLSGSVNGEDLIEQKITDDFKESNWYHFNREQDRAL